MDQAVAGTVPVVTVRIEVPRGSFAKRDATRRVEFLSPLPCPFNYGCVPTLPGADRDALDAVLLGPRLAVGTTLEARVQAVIRFTDAGQEDDKLICAAAPLGVGQRRLVLAFFHLYALAKRLLHAGRRRPGSTRCDGFGDVAGVLERAARRAVLKR